MIVLSHEFCQAVSFLPALDAFVKRQSYRDPEDDRRSVIGGSRFTDFIAKHWQVDFEGWSVQSVISQGYENRRVSGWHLGTAKRFFRELKPSCWLRFSQVKELDIFCRRSLGYENHKEGYYNSIKITLRA